MDELTERLDNVAIEEEGPYLFHPKFNSDILNIIQDKVKDAYDLNIKQQEVFSSQVIRETSMRNQLEAMRSNPTRFAFWRRRFGNILRETDSEFANLSSNEQENLEQLISNRINTKNERIVAIHLENEKLKNSSRLFNFMRRTRLGMDVYS
jgi:hypothetical protein